MHVPLALIAHSPSCTRKTSDSCRGSGDGDGDGRGDDRGEGRGERIGDSDAQGNGDGEGDGDGRGDDVTDEVGAVLVNVVASIITATDAFKHLLHSDRSRENLQLGLQCAARQGRTRAMRRQARRVHALMGRRWGEAMWHSARPTQAACTPEQRRAPPMNLIHQAATRACVPN
eukprot:731551-Pleurochrysis_carterae.AAC.5